MDPDALWRLFVKTGLPELYSLYQTLRRVEETA